MNLKYTETNYTSSESQEIVEIKLWSLYLITNPTAFYTEMIMASIDRGPVEKNPQTSGRVTFRFTATTFKNQVKKLLYAHRIPVIVNSTAFHGMKRSSDRVVAV